MHMFDTWGFVKGMGDDFTPLRYRGVSTREENEVRIDFSAKDESEDPFSVSLHWNPKFRMLSAYIVLDTMLPTNWYGWAIECVNDKINMTGCGRISKVSVAPPQKGDSFLSLFCGWELPFPQNAFVHQGNIEGLQWITKHSLVALALEVPEIEALLDAVFKETPIN